MNWQRKQEKLKHLKRENSPSYNNNAQRPVSGIKNNISPSSSRPTSAIYQNQNLPLDQNQNKPQNQRQLSPKGFFKNLVDKSTEEDKTMALIKFLSKPAVMHSLYDLMFLDRRNHRAGDFVGGKLLNN